MKTAKDFLEGTIFTGEGFTNFELEQLIEVMNGYAKYKCTQQRILCDQYVSSNWHDIENATTNCTDAPEPTFD